MALPVRLVPCTSSSALCNRLIISKRPLSVQLASVFAGQKLRISKGFTKYTLEGSYCLIKAQLDKSSNAPHDLLGAGEHFLDDVSDWISRKIAEKLRPHLPENFDVADWLPKSLHSRIHSVERAAAVCVRECLILVLFSFVFARIGVFCQWLSRIHFSRKFGGPEHSEFDYQVSVFSAMEDPLKAGLLLLQLTHMLHVIGPLFKLKFSLFMVRKVRSIGFIIVISWFLFKWKDLVLQRVISQNRSDKPRLIALDKVLSLLMYYIAGSCIGEVSGFALRSVLAIGGVSGIAVGLAAKEIVGNFLGGAFLFVTRPFVVGDIVKSSTFEGLVEDIDFLHSKLRGYDQALIIVPNSIIINGVIINHSRAKCMQLNALFVLRNTDILLVDKITDEINGYLINHPSVDLVNGTKPFCYLKNMGSEGLEIELGCSVVHEELVAYFKAKQEILVNAAKIVTNAGAAFETNASVVLMEKEGRFSSAEMA